MEFYGFQKVTLLDYPGEVASTLFTFGCNLRCPFCHNPQLINADRRPDLITWDEIYGYLVLRKNVLGGVVISGGEPLMHSWISEAVREIKNLGLKVKIDTNGFFPEMLEKLDPDYIAMDIKTSLKKYKLLGYSCESALSVKESAGYIMKSGISYEFRTTVVPGIVDDGDLESITDMIAGAEKYSLAQFRPVNTLSADYESITPYPQNKLEEMKEKASKKVRLCELRTNY